jgi:hypothetical protein
VRTFFGFHLFQFLDVIARFDGYDDFEVFEVFEAFESFEAFTDRAC